MISTLFQSDRFFIYVYIDCSISLYIYIICWFYYLIEEWMNEWMNEWWPLVCDALFVVGLYSSLNNCLANGQGVVNKYALDYTKWVSNIQLHKLYFDYILIVPMAYQTGTS